MKNRIEDGLIFGALYRRSDVEMVTRKSNDQCIPRCRAGRHGHFSFYQCRNVGKVQRNTYWFCGVCDPIAREERRVARELGK